MIRILVFCVPPLDLIFRPSPLICLPEAPILPTQCLPKAWELGRSCLEVSKSRLWSAGATHEYSPCSTGGHRHLVVESAFLVWFVSGLTLPDLYGCFTSGSFLRSKAPEVVWCCLYIFKSILTIWTVMNWIPHRMHPMTSFTHVFLDDGMDHFQGFLLPHRSFMVPQSIGLEIKHFRTWAFWGCSQQLPAVNEPPRSVSVYLGHWKQSQLIVSDGFTGWIHWSTSILLGLLVKRLVWGSAVSCFTEQVPKMVLDWNVFWRFFGGVPP